MNEEANGHSYYSLRIVRALYFLFIQPEIWTITENNRSINAVERHFPNIGMNKENQGWFSQYCD
jgi:hypothetical protein